MAKTTDYKVTGRMVRIHHGTLVLSEDQASARMQHLKRIGKSNSYELTGAVEFKNGEVFGYVGELPKILAEDLSSKAEADAEAKKAAAEAKKLAEAEAAAKKEAEAKATKEWDANENLRTQFEGDFEAYLASILE